MFGSFNESIEILERELAWWWEHNGAALGMHTKECETMQYAIDLLKAAEVVAVEQFEADSEISGIEA